MPKVVLPCATMSDGDDEWGDEKRILDLVKVQKRCCATENTSICEQLADQPISKSHKRRKTLRRSLSADSGPQIRKRADERAMKIGLSNIRHFFEVQTSCGSGAHRKDIQQMLDTVSMAIMSQEIADEKLQSAVHRMFFITRKQQLRGLQLQRMNQKTFASDGTVALTIPKAKKSYGRFAPLTTALESIMHWFHTESSIVTLDRSRQDAFRGRFSYYVAGKFRKIKCQRRLAYATVKGLVAHLKESSFFKVLVTDLGRSISDIKLASCVCRCISPKSIQECSCPICVEFMLLVQAWNCQRAKWRKDRTCTCTGCASSKYKLWMGASKDVREFMNIVCCPPVARPELKLPQDVEVPRFRRLACCRKNERIPAHVKTCANCGWGKVFYRCPLEFTQDPAHYQRWELTEVPGTTRDKKKKYAKVLRRIECTREQLLHAIFDKHKALIYHLWIDRMARHQEKLDVATFDGNSTIIVKTDFAAAAKLQVSLLHRLFVCLWRFDAIQAAYTSTCEWPTTANQCVALVIHSPQCLKKAGTPREVICDHWRAWSDAKPGEQFHQMFMRDIAAYYKAQNPRLTTMKVNGFHMIRLSFLSPTTPFTSKVKSDGCSHQYKGLRNFRAVALFHLSEQSMSARQAAHTADSITVHAAAANRQQKLSVAAAVAGVTPLHVKGNDALKLFEGSGWQDLKLQQMQKKLTMSSKVLSSLPGFI